MCGVYRVCMLAFVVPVSVQFPVQVDFFFPFLVCWENVGDDGVRNLSVTRATGTISVFKIKLLDNITNTLTYTQ